MPVFTTQLEGETLMLIEAETTGAFAKSDLEIRPNPMAAFHTAVVAMGTMGRVMSARIQKEYAGRGITSAEVSFGVKVDQAGSVMIALEAEKAQFIVKLNIRTDG